MPKDPEVPIVRLNLDDTRISFYSEGNPWKEGDICLKQSNNLIFLSKKELAIIFAAHQATFSTDTYTMSNCAYGDREDEKLEKSNG